VAASYEITLTVWRSGALLSERDSGLHDPAGILLHRTASKTELYISVCRNLPVRYTLCSAANAALPRAASLVTTVVQGPRWQELLQFFSNKKLHPRRCAGLSLSATDAE
jgi:hypothetical protein